MATDKLGEKTAIDPATAERLALYRWATQDPDTHAALLAEIYRRVRPGREAQQLREDFAGNAADSVAWVAAGSRRQALAVDIDPATVAYAQARAQRLLGRHAQRLHCLVDDVHSVAPPQVPAADVLSVLNFSSYYLHTRKALIRYFRHARAALSDHGIAVLNAYGGADAMVPRVDRHRVTPLRERGEREALAPFDYVWEQCSYDAYSARTECRIHFELDDPADAKGKRRLDSAFIYRWRLWTLPELTDALREAGFRRAQVWRHTATPKGDGYDIFLGPVRKLRNRTIWLAYVVGIA